MKNFCIISNSLKDENLVLTNKIKEIIENNGAKTLVIAKGVDSQFTESKLASKVLKESKEAIDYAIVLGGDGTILQAAKDLYGLDVPIMGINLGTLGFLTEAEIDNLEEAINKLMNQEYDIQDRIMLSGVIKRNGEEVFIDTALNDIVIGRYGLSRVMSIEVYVNDELINVYHGDGILVSTPTGTTAYNLSAGGPIAKPDAKLLMITPICVHSLYSRSVIVASEDVIKIRVREERKLQHAEAMATFDGRAGFKLEANDEIIISQSNKKTRFIKLGEKHFFDIVREKIEMK